MARRTRKRFGKGKGSKPLQLTSMMDILTVLLLFLLKSFVVEGEVITPVPGVDLPESSSETTPHASVRQAEYFGMWADRDDMAGQSSRAWLEDLRSQQWMRL